MTNLFGSETESHRKDEKERGEEEEEEEAGYDPHDVERYIVHYTVVTGTPDCYMVICPRSRSNNPILTFLIEGNKL